MEPSLHRLFRAALTRRHYLPAVLVVASACASTPFSSPSTTEPLRAAANQPAAVGEVSVKRADQANMELVIKVEHLAPPQKIVSGATTYVVWAEPLQGGGGAQNLGALELDNDRAGELTTKTAARPVKITVTPEPIAQSARPTHEAVMWASIQDVL